MVGHEIGDGRFRSYSGGYSCTTFAECLKPIAIGRVHWLWTVLRSVVLARHTFLVLLLSPNCVSPAKAVEMWG
jgi:hypothetical protein